jgi:hypothetical protein
MSTRPPRLTALEDTDEDRRTFLPPAIYLTGRGWHPRYDADGVQGRWRRIPATRRRCVTGPASFGFTFSCERSSRSTSPNPPTGQLRIQLAYTDHGTSLFLGSPFSIHGIVDTIDPVLESAICIGQEPPPPSPFGNELIFLGRYRPTTSPPPPGFPQTCPAHETKTTPLCRFEVIVRDNDQDFAPSPGDYFSIKLSTVTEPLITEFPATTVFYARAGFLEGGSLTVK